MTDYRARMEPEAQANGFDSDQALSLVSIAISLKRIADALSGVGESLLTMPINSYGEGIGDAIQGQFVRGQAGISQYEGR